jgi:hypothetical protein
MIEYYLNKLLVQNYRPTSTESINQIDTFRAAEKQKG